MSLNKLIIFAAAFMLASFIGSRPAAAQVDPCAPENATSDTLDCDGDTIPNNQDTCDEALMGLAPGYCGDDDGDSVVNGLDQCPDTDITLLAVSLKIESCDTGVENLFFSDSGCSLDDLVMECADGAKNHGKFVSCVSHTTNALKRVKLLTGKEKGQIQRCAAKSSIGKKTHP